MALDSNVYDTIIVGSGWAGLSTAKELNSKGYTNFIVLEARDRIGGRSFTSYEFGESIPQDMGTYFLLSSNNNPAFEYIDEAGIEPVEQDPDPDLFVIAANGTIYTDDLIQSMLEKYWYPFYGSLSFDEENADELFSQSFYNKEYIDAWNSVDYYDASSVIEADVPLQHIVDKYLESGNIIDPEALGFFELILEIFVAADLKANATELSFLWSNELEWYDGSSYSIGRKQKQKQKQRNISLKKGFKTLLDAYAAEVVDNIRLSSKVTEINFEADPIEVTYENSDGTLSTLKADTVVVTVPIGVLRAGDIDFIPDLDDGANYLDDDSEEYETKKYALEHISAGKALHCALYWENMDDEDVFWPKDPNFFQLVAPEPSLQGRFTQWLNSYQFNGNIPILVGTVYADHVDSMMDMTDEEIVEEAVQKLRSVFGNVTEPSKYIVKNWVADEFTKGAYSSNLEEYYWSRFYLSKPLPGEEARNARLYFAGEGTSPNWYGTVQGAIFEGERA